MQSNRFRDGVCSTSPVGNAHEVRRPDNAVPGNPEQDAERHGHNGRGQNRGRNVDQDVIGDACDQDGKTVDDHQERCSVEQHNRNCQHYAGRIPQWHHNPFLGF